MFNKKTSNADIAAAVNSMTHGELPENNEEDERFFDQITHFQQLQRENSNKINSMISPMTYLYPMFHD